MSIIDPAFVADRAGLRHVDPSELPIVRRRCGSGFTYVGSDARRLTGRARERIELLAIPPAWRDVRVADDERCHVQAIGVDDDGRTQYRYHEAFRAAADEAKFARLGTIGVHLPRLRSAVRERLADCGSDPAGDVAGVIALIDHTLIRVGSHRYADEHETYGASTLLRRHLTRHPAGLRLRFTAKGGIHRDVVITDRSIADPILRCHANGLGPDEAVFTGPQGGRITGDTVAEALSEWSGTEMTAKELRTWGATAAMITELMAPRLASASESDHPLLAAYDGVAARLGNTRDVARSSYVAPIVISAFDDGSLHGLWRRSRRSSIFDRGEQCSRKLFAD